MTSSLVNQEQIQQLQAEKDKVAEKLTTTEGKLSLIEQEKIRLQKVVQ